MLFDVIIDSYWYGNATRVSPEAPVPILLKNSDEEIRLGGACNVALNIASLGGEVEIIGIIGNDEDGENTKKFLKKRELNQSLLLKQTVKL